jgi:hypothetical protein
LTFLTFVAGGSFSPYSWNDSTGRTVKEYAIKERNVLGRFMSINFTSSFTIAPKKSREIIAENKDNFADSWISDFQQFALFPETFIDFEIPWKVTFSHVWALNANTNKQSTFGDGKTYIQTQTLTMNGDVSLTKRWKLIANINVDVKTMLITNSQLTMTRDMHCWNLSFFWTPIGTNKSFIFRLNANSSLFQDAAKLELRKPPELF